LSTDRGCDRDRPLCRRTSTSERRSGASGTATITQQQDLQSGGARFRDCLAVGSGASDAKLWQSAGYTLNHSACAKAFSAHVACRTLRSGVRCGQTRHRRLSGLETAAQTETMVERQRESRLASVDRSVRSHRRLTCSDRRNSGRCRFAVVLQPSQRARDLRTQ
jgi:hypothetical protein